MDNEALIITLGVLANAFYVAGCIFKSPKKTTFAYVLGNFAYMGYFTLLGVSSPLINVIIGTASGLILIKLTCTKRVKITAIITASIMSFLMLYHFTIWQDALAIAAAWCLCFANLNIFNYIYYKVGIILSQCLWIVYALYAHDYAMLFTCTFMIVTTGCSLFYNLKQEGYFRDVRIRLPSIKSI